MHAFTVPFVLLLLMTSEHLHAYPSVDSTGTGDYRPVMGQFKHGFGILQRQPSTGNFNDENADDSVPMPCVYSIGQRANRKRLIDF